MPRYAVLFALLASLPVAAVPPLYPALELQARANLGDGFNLPPGTSISNSTPSLNASRTVTIRTFASAQGIWRGAGGDGAIVYTAPDDAFLSDAKIQSNGRIVFPRNSLPPNGVYQIAPGAATASLFSNQPLGAASFIALSVNDLGAVGYRAGFSSGNAWVSVPESGSGSAVHVADNSIGSGPYSALLTPSMNAQREISGVVRSGDPGQTGNAQPDAIRVFSTSGAMRVVAVDRDTDPASDILSFDNGAPINAAGQVAFIATIVGGTRVVRRVDANGLSVTLASAPSATLSSIEFFPPVLNDAGLVAFRGRDGTNRQAIFVADGTGVRTVVTRGDIVPSDLGNAWIDQNVPGDSAFSGAVAINANGDLAFAAALTPAGNNQVEWGTGLYVARAVVDVIFNDDFGG